MLRALSLVSKNVVTAFEPQLFNQQTRNTFILRRSFPPPLHKKGGKPSKMRGRHFVYDLVEYTGNQKRPDLKIILNQYVEGVGNAGDILTLGQNEAYKKYLMPGLAMYASPENVEKYKVDETKPIPEKKYSSQYVHSTMEHLSRMVLSITMNKLQPWVLEPWHVSTCFRKSGVHVPEHAIKMPPVQIKGPDLSLQEKEFYVTVVINKTEKVNVRCRIHHWATGLDRIPNELDHWKKPCEPLFPEQAEVLAAMPLPE